MYIDNFINNKYITLFRYCINLNKDNNIIVDLKYGKQNKMIFLRRVNKHLNIKNAYSLRFLLLKLRKRNNITLYKNLINFYNKKILKKKLSRFRRIIRKVRMNLKEKKIREKKFIKSLKIKFKAVSKEWLRKFRQYTQSFTLINANVNFNKRFKKVKMLGFIVNKLLHNQVLGMVYCLMGFWV